MNLYIQQRFFSWGDKFSIYDEEGNEKYYVEGEVFTFGKKLHLYDLCGNECAYIEQRLFTFLPKYTIYQNGEEIAEVIKELTFFHPEYTVSGPRMNSGWTVQGDFFDHDYEITENNKVIAAVSKEWFTLGDAYEISINQEEDVTAILSVVLVIDACIDAKNN